MRGAPADRAEAPAVAEAMWIEALVDASIYREWVINVGRRDARTGSRICYARSRCAWIAGVLGDGKRYELPMTQEQIGDATGLTSVHVNRTIKALAAEGMFIATSGT